MLKGNDRQRVALGKSGQCHAVPRIATQHSRDDQRIARGRDPVGELFDVARRGLRRTWPGTVGAVGLQRPHGFTQDFSGQT